MKEKPIPIRVTNEVQLQLDLDTPCKGLAAKLIAHGKVIGFEKFDSIDKLIQWAHEQAKKEKTQ